MNSYQEILGHRRSRRNLLRMAVRLTAGGALALTAGNAFGGRVFARQATPGSGEQFQTAFSDKILRSFGLPEIKIDVGPDGVKAPSKLEAGYYLVTLSAADGYVAYLDFTQPPAGLDEKQATKLALAAGREDLAQHDWVYAGGTNTFENLKPVSFVINLAPGEYKIAASYYVMNGDTETMKLVPLTVTGAAVTGNEPKSTVILEATDELRYHVTPDPVPAGPQVWKFTNTGQHHSHHAVLFGIPEAVTADQIIAEFQSMMSGTPPAGEPLVAKFTQPGYAALQSGGQTTWLELDLKPGKYAAICFIMDPGVMRPHLLDGMVTVFTVA